MKWTGLILPCILPAPGQLSLTVGVAAADGWSKTFKTKVVPLFDTGAGVSTGCHMRSATEKVSPFVVEMLVANTVVASLI